MQIKKNTLCGLVVVVIIIILGVFFCLKTNKEKGYSVVYLNTGEVYVGKLSVSSDLVIRDAYLYQVIQDPADQTKTTFQIQPVSEALWAPKELTFVKENVVFYGPLLDSSKIAETLANQK